VDIKEKTSRSANPGKLTLFKEGLFYKCYNEDAMVFFENIKEYKVSSKYIKSMNDTVLTLGFPTSQWKKDGSSYDFINKLGAQNSEENDLFIEFSLNSHVKNNFNAFKSKIISEQQLAISNAIIISPKENIIDKIKSYDLANRTPMQAMQFIQELKEIIA
jgi:hypothetical protein